MSLIDGFKVFSLFLRLKAKFSKYEIARLDSVEGVSEVFCSLESINLTADTIKILGVHF